VMLRSNDFSIVASLRPRRS